MTDTNNSHYEKHFGASSAKDAGNSKVFFESPLRWAFKKNYFYNENCCSDIIKTVIRLIYFKAQNGYAILCFENPYRV
jgi:hypothetical protein